MSNKETDKAKKWFFEDINKTDSKTDQERKKIIDT